MNCPYILSLKILRKMYGKIFKVYNTKPFCEQDPDIASKLIYDKLMSEEPVMIARFGGFELATVVNFLGVNKKNKSIIKYIKNEEPNWSWNKKLINYMHINAGFFPATIPEIEKFCELMLKDKQHVDILGSWLRDEKFIDKDIKAIKIHLQYIEPFWSKNPWIRALKGKKILVVHPFSKTILKQYQKRQYLFKNKDILSEFKSFTVIKAVQSLKGGDGRFKDWFEALEYMKREIDKIDYDICLIGAGAYGFPLAAHVKKQGKKSVHMGGSLQLLFGIRGKRWENPEYGVKEWGIKKNSYVDLINEYWVHPDEDEKPQGAKNVEGGCYW